ncbi:MAG: helix-turn-helix domain-containing protein, partial [Chloroflexota bacterium]|nr:helix-turn-helix domain-containing protein [Chloroflexota bacterium]
SNPSWANLAALKRAGTGLLSRLRHDTHSAINIGIGRYHPGLRGLTGSYQDALAALSLGRRFHGQNRVHCLDGLGIAAFVGISDEATKIDLATYLLSPLDHGPDLLATLEAFFAEDCAPSPTAAILSIHRNTLAYRLDKITSLTGLDPRCFDEAVQIRLALLLRSLRNPIDCAIAL